MEVAFLYCLWYSGPYSLIGVPKHYPNKFNENTIASFKLLYLGRTYFPLLLSHPLLKPLLFLFPLLFSGYLQNVVILCMKGAI